MEDGNATIHFNAPEQTAAPEIREHRHFVSFVPL